MKALVRDRYGSPDVLSLAEVDPPVLTDAGALVRVHASSVNAYDWHMLRGKPYIARLSEGLRSPKTRVLGLDVAGVVEAVGSEVTHIRPGDRVFGSRSGAFAEYISGKSMVPMPAGLSFEQAAAIPTAGQTALQGLRDHGELREGQRVLVNGAGGGVGSFAVQIAKALGGEVTAVTRGANVEAMRGLGADHVIDYEHEDFTRGSQRYDVILDAGGNRSASSMRRVLTPDGTLVLVAAGGGQWVGPVARVVVAKLRSRFGGPKMRGFMATVSREDLLVLKEMVEAGSLTPLIDSTYPLERAPDAIRHLEGGHPRGKVVVTI